MKSAPGVGYLVHKNWQFGTDLSAISILSVIRKQCFQILNTAITCDDILTRSPQLWRWL